MEEKQKEINWEELSELSGENTVKPTRFIIPVLKFDGRVGKFTLLVPDTQGNFIPEDKGNEARFVILKVRRSYSAFERTPEGSIRYFTNEHNSFRDPLTLFERRKDSKRPRMIDSGEREEIRKRWPKLRLVQNLYCLFEDQIVKFRVRGKSLSALFEYYSQFAPSEHLFQFETVVQCHQETSEGGLDYWVMDFFKGEPSDIELVSEKIKEVAEALKQQDRAYQEMPKMEEEIAEVQRETEEIVAEEVIGPTESNGEERVTDLPE